MPPQEQEDAPFDGFEDSESGRLVSKAIERMSLGADSDMSENGDQNPVPVYSSTLLQQFVEKTAMLSEPRKRRSKCGKKMNNDNEYPCVSNVSPDSGIQSVDNSPLHLAVSPVSPSAPTQSPIQPPITTKPAVNVDRVLYPPKRKPGRPAKAVSTQPRGPGRPRLKPEVEKIQKIQKVEKEKNESSKNLKNPDSRIEKKEVAKETAAKRTKEDASTARKRGSAKPVAPKEEKEDAAPASKRVKGKPATYQKKRFGSLTKLILSQDNVHPKTRKSTGATSSPMRVKCLSRSASKLVPQCDGRSCRKVRQERSCTQSNKTSVPLTRQKQTSCEHQITNDQKVSSTGKKTGSKENRSNATVSVASRKQNLTKKTAPPATRRVLKENKCNKKTTVVNFETNGVGVQTLISLPVGHILKAENVERASGNSKCDKAMQPTQQHNHCHKSHYHHHYHHHHKHRRRLVAPKNPICINPCFIQELEKLIEEFKSCNLGRNNTGANHTELPQIFRVKKLTKKRKGATGETGANDDQKLKRRLKKEKVLAGADSKSSANTSTSSNPNEQRLPLKKRHYHVSSPHSSQSSNASCADANAIESNSTESHIEEAIEATITRYGGGGGGGGSSSTSSVHDEDAVPVKKPRDAESAAAEKPASDEDKSTVQSEVQSRRKKKIVKDLRVTVTKLQSEAHGVLDKSDKSDKSADKSSKTMEKSGKSEKAAAVEKSTKADKAQNEEKANTEHVRAEKNIKADLETNVPEIPENGEAVAEIKTASVGNSSVPNLMNNTAATILTKKKMRRRKTINRTGFPTLKKKKKKPIDSPSVTKPAATTNEVCRKCKDAPEDVEDNKASLAENDARKTSAEKNVGGTKSDVKNLDNSTQETSSRSGSDEVAESCPASGQLRVRKDLVESDSSVLSEKLYPNPIKDEKLPDCRHSLIYDENASLEESLERYNQSMQRIAELNEENLRKLERANAQAAAGVKMELSGCFNNNHKRRRGSSSPANLYVGGRSTKRLRSAGYDTESEAPPSSDVASEDQEVRKPTGAPTYNRKKQSRWKKRYLQSGNMFSECKKDLESKKLEKNAIVYPIDEHNAAEQLPGITGKLLRQKKTPFQLQYDLLWLHAQSKLSGRDSDVPSWNYR